MLVGFGGVDAVEGVFFGGVEGGEGDGEGEILKEHLHILSKCLYSNIDSLFTYLQHIMNLYFLICSVLFIFGCSKYIDSFKNIMIM